MGPRTWRRVIFRDTQAKAHYRSLGSGNQLVVTPALGTPNVSGVYMFPAMQIINAALSPFHAAGSVFWQRPQVQELDYLVTPPDFAGDVVLRGGICRLLVGAYPDNVSIRVKAYAVWTKDTPDITLYSAYNNTSRQVEFDPSLIPDFTTKFGKILYSKQAMVPVGEQFEIVHRLKPQKIDQNVYVGSAAEPAGNQLWWLLIVAPLDSNALANNLTVVNSYNVSFSADAVIP